MMWGDARVILAAAAALTAAGCERLGLGPDAADSAPVKAAQAPTGLDLTPHDGELYVDFMAQPGMERYSLQALGVPDDDRARFEAAMPGETPAQLASGGGAEALVFSGCAQTGCSGGMAVLAIDAASGAVFVGVRDALGADELVPNDRVEALLRLTSPRGRWDEPRGQSAAPTEAAGP
jgi:hypothetical protein